MSYDTKKTKRQTKECYSQTVLGRVQPRLIVYVCVCVSVRHHLNAYISETNRHTIMKLGRYVGRSVRLIVLKFHELRKSYYVTMT